MNLRRIGVVIIFASVIIFTHISCDLGIEPKPSTEPTGFSGKITFLGEWPESIQRTHLVVFKNPLRFSNDFNVRNLKFVSSEIPYGTEEFEYSSLDSAVIPGSGNLSPGEYAYIAVAQSETPDLSLDRKDWIVAGIYFAPGDTLHPGKLVIPEGVVVENINIICDFDDPPPQPPGVN